MADDKANQPWPSTAVPHPHLSAAINDNIVLDNGSAYHSPIVGLSTVLYVYSIRDAPNYVTYIFKIRANGPYKMR
jgi:hypothetical protein